MAPAGLGPEGTAASSLWKAAELVVQAVCSIPGPLRSALADAVLLQPFKQVRGLHICSESGVCVEQLARQDHMQRVAAIVHAVCSVASVRTPGLDVAEVTVSASCLVSSPGLPAARNSNAPAACCPACRLSIRAADLLRPALHAAPSTQLPLLQVAGGAAFAEKLLLDVCGDARQRSVLHALGFQLGVVTWQRDWEQRHTAPATPPRELEAQVSCAALVTRHSHDSNIESNHFMLANPL